eukprot:338184-Hanusia_phi.AAC.1
MIGPGPGTPSHCGLADRTHRADSPRLRVTSGNVWIVRSLSTVTSCHRDHRIILAAAVPPQTAPGDGAKAAQPHRLRPGGPGVSAGPRPSEAGGHHPNAMIR